MDYIIATGPGYAYKMPQDVYDNLYLPLFTQHHAESREYLLSNGLEEYSKEFNYMLQNLDQAAAEIIAKRLGRYAENLIV